MAPWLPQIRVSPGGGPSPCPAASVTSFFMCKGLGMGTTAQAPPCPPFPHLPRANRTGTGHAHVGRLHERSQGQGKGTVPGTKGEV